VTGVSRRDQLLDIAAGAALAGFCAGLTPVTRLAQPAIRPLDAGGYLLLVVAGGAVALHRRRPVAAYLLSVGAATVFLGLGFPGWPVYVGAFGGLVVLTAGAPRRVWVPLGVGGGVALALATGRPEAWQPARMAGTFVVWCALVLLAGEASVRRARRAEADARQRVVEERLRIARELHDVLSHSLATISLQAGVGLHLIESDPSQAREALASIRTVSNEALAQARGALSVVRGPGGQDEPAPHPSLSDVPSLVASVRSTGLDVELEADSFARGSGEVEAAAYRVVQEALTNVMRHAGDGARAWVTLRCHGDQLCVEVRDNGHGVVAEAPPGHGLAGMRERARALDAQFTAGPHPGGGFLVQARFPAGDRP
jgi:signal transduction histidine kinase